MPTVSARQGIRLQLLLGSGVPRPAPADVARAVERVEVVTDDGAASAFQIVFKAGRDGRRDRADQPLLRSPALAPWSRAVLTVAIGPRTQVLVDGVITHRQLVPGAAPGDGIVAVTGEDLTVLMDLEERIVSYPGMSDPAIVAVLLARYARYGITPQVVPPAVTEAPLPAVRVPVQHGTDLAHLRKLAARAHHVFVLRPGPVPLTSVAYWGPAPRPAAPLPALSVGTGGPAYVAAPSFAENALAPESVEGLVTDADTARRFPLTAVPPPLRALARSPDPAERTALLRDAGGLTAPVALGRAQATAAASADVAVVAEGEVDTARYAAVLEPNRLVGVRGAGEAFDGLYRVRRVTHLLERGSHRQRFRLARPGTGTTTPVVATNGGG